MENITSIRFTPLPPDSPYIQTFRMYYVQNGKEKSWDLLKVHDSVAIIILNKSSNKLVFVKQFRPAVYYAMISADPTNNPEKLDFGKYPPKDALTIELCAGIVDKSKPLVQIAQEEIEEECGYYVPVDRIEAIMTYRSGVGTNGSMQTLYYCEVTDSDKIESGGGGVDDEIIDVVELSIDEARDMLSKGANNNAPPSCLLGVSWFLANRLSS